MADLLRFRVSVDLKAVSDLSQAEHSVLAHVAEAPGQKVGQRNLAMAMFWSKSRISRQLTRMQAKGFVERSTSTVGTGVEVSLTAKGRKAIEAAEAVHAKAVREHLFQVATEDELTVLLRLADRLVYEVDSELPH